MGRIFVTRSDTNNYLIYLTITCLELCYVVYTFFHFMHSTRVSHWDVVLCVDNVSEWNRWSEYSLLIQWWFAPWRLLWYRLACMSAYPTFSRILCIFLGRLPVSWNTKKQYIFSRSFAESEYCSMVFSTSELKWLRELLNFLRSISIDRVSLHYDIQYAIHIASNNVFHTKYREIICHYVHDALHSSNWHIASQIIHL